MKIRNKLYKASIIITITLVLLEIYRWYLWEVDFERLTYWDFLTNKGNTGLLWNLLLAWVAVFLSWLVYKSSNRLLTKFLSLLWILWLPNTLYMVTDLKYFRSDKVPTLFHETLFFALFGIVGVLLFVLSVYLVWLKFKFSRKWLAIIISLAILGVIAGRVLRWNSWDIFTDAPQMLLDILNLF